MMEFWRGITMSRNEDKIRREYARYQLGLMSEYARTQADATKLTVDQYLKEMCAKYPLPHQTLYLNTLHKLLRYCTFNDSFYTEINIENKTTGFIDGMHISIPEPEKNPEPILFFDRESANILISDLNVLKHYAQTRMHEIKLLPKKQISDISGYLNLNHLSQAVDMFNAKSTPYIDLYSKTISASNLITATAKFTASCEGLGINPLVATTFSSVWKGVKFSSNS